jgi:carboxypeptidase family protein
VRTERMASPRHARGWLRSLVGSLCLSAMTWGAIGAAGLRIAVIDADDQKPLPTARVTIMLGNQQVASNRPADANGIAEFPDLAPGDGYSVRISFHGYKTEELSGVVVEADENRTSRIVELRPYTAVSLVTLLAAPAAYSGRPVKVWGFLIVAFEGDALYLHGEDARMQLTKNALWLDIDASGRKSFKKHDHKYVLIEGDFNATRKGHMDLFSGTLERIHRVESWPP